MQSLLYVPSSNQAANASLMTVQVLRSPGASTIKVNTVANAPTKFLATMGTPHTFTDPVTSEVITVISDATAVDFYGSISGSDVIIDQIAPGYVDTNGSKVGDIIVIRPLAEWANNLYNVLNQSLNPDGTIKTTAVAYNPAVSDYIQAGGIWSALTGLNAAMTALTAWQGGYLGTIAAVASRAFTLSKDTYVDVLRTLSGTTNTFSLVYTEVANGAAAPALAANSVRLAKVVSGASTITTIIQYGKDSLNNIIYPISPTAVVPVPQKIFINTRDSGSGAGSGVFDIGGLPYAWIDPADYAVPGRTTYMRLVVQINKTAADLVAAVVRRQSDNVVVIAVTTDGQANGGNNITAATILYNSSNSTLVLRSNELPFPTTAALVKLSMWNQTSAANAIMVPIAYLEVYWR